MNQSESEMAASEVMKSDKSLFIQELLIQTLSMDLDSLDVSGQSEEVENQTRETVTVDESVTSGSPSTVDSVTSDRVKQTSKLNERRLPSIEDEEMDEVSVVESVVGMTCNQVVPSDNGNTTPTNPIAVVDPGPDENINPLVSLPSATSSNNTSTLSCHPAPLTATNSKLRSSHSAENGSITSVTSAPVPSTPDPLTVLTTNFLLLHQ